LGYRYGRNAEGFVKQRIEEEQVLALGIQGIRLRQAHLDSDKGDMGDDLREGGRGEEGSEMSQHGNDQIKGTRRRKKKRTGEEQKRGLINNQ
jgi:hypothetical protein